ncbi:MAG: hypothetical protein LBH10_06800 [Burkholderiaceae bacterium]|nr:hypothetical protein [Burkholderiaceae bacterium]
MKSVRGIIETATVGAEAELESADDTLDGPEPDAQSETRALIAPAGLHGQRAGNALGQLAPGVRGT